MAQQFFPGFGRPVAQRPVRTHGFVAATDNPSTVITATALAIALSVPTVTVATGNAPVSLQPLAVTLSAPTATVSGPVTVGAGSLTLAISIPTVTAVGTAQSIPVPYGRPFAQRGIRFWGPPSASTPPETTFPQTVQLGELDVTLAPQDIVRTSTVTQSANALTLTLSVPSVSAIFPTPGVSGNPVVLAPRQLIRSRLKPKRPYVAQFGVIEELAPSPLTATASSLAVALTAPTVTRTSTVARSAGGQVIALSVPSVSLTGGPGFLAAGGLNLALSPPNVTRVAGAVTQSSGAQAIALLVPTAVANQVVTVSPVVVTLSFTDVTISRASVRQTGNQTIALSLPAVTVSTPPAVRAAGSLGIQLSLPDVTVRAIITRQPPENVVALSLPDVTATTGLTVRVLTPVVLALRIGVVDVLGATTLPIDVFDGSIDSRVSERTIESRRLPYTLEFRA